jgi:hypothetical protein
MVVGTTRGFAKTTATVNGQPMLLSVCGYSPDDKPPESLLFGGVEWKLSETENVDDDVVGHYISQ